MDKTGFLNLLLGNENVGKELFPSVAMGMDSIDPWGVSSIEGRDHSIADFSSHVNTNLSTLRSLPLSTKARAAPAGC